MKLDDKLLKDMIAEALEEASKDFEAQMSKDAQKTKKDEKEEKKERVNVSGGKEFEPEDLQEQETTPEIAAAQKKAAEEEAQSVKAKVDVANLKAEKAREEAEKAKEEAGSTMEESFQLTKGRLRQIIREELITAKKQGII